jgi:sirohydrochlorin cobaltochelatase
MTYTPSAVLLFAHGSRDPLWRAPIDALADEVRRQSPQTAVRCAFLELMAPELSEAVAALMAEGHRAIRIVPLFLGVGRHAREDLPKLVAQLRHQHPELQLELQPPIAEQAEIIRCMATVALSPPPSNRT